MVASNGVFPGVKGGHSQGYIVLAPQSTGHNTLPAPALALGPTTQHFASTARSGVSDSLCYGLDSSFDFVDPGFVIETLLVAAAPVQDKPMHVSIPGHGVNNALMKYGDFLLARHDKKRALGDHNELTTHIGYSTTAFYFYNLCDCNGPAPLKDGKPSVHIRNRCHTATEGNVQHNTSIPVEYLQGSVVPGTCDSYEDTLLAVHAVTHYNIYMLPHIIP